MPTVNWTHPNPLSTNVNYDLRINGVDPGFSIGSPATSNTIDINNRFISASGDMKYYFWLRYGYANVMPWPSLTFTGNVEKVPATVSRLKF